MHPNSMRFREKRSFKCALESFTSVNWHLKTALRRQNKNSKDRNIEEPQSKLFLTSKQSDRNSFYYVKN